MITDRPPLTQPPNSHQLPRANPTNSQFKQAPYQGAI
jgi:hypothetical protein